MSIQTEIDRIISAVHAAHEKVAEKGGTTAEPYLVANLESAIDSIPEASDPVLQSKTVSPSTSSQTVKPDTGYDGLSQVTVNAMPTATQATPSISVSSAGLITASATQSAGYVSAGTKSATKQLTVQAAKTVTPTTSNQTAVASGRYTTGAITVKGDANLKAENIKSGVSIFGVTGSHSGAEDLTAELTEYSALNTELESVIDSLPSAGGSGSPTLKSYTLRIEGSASYVSVECSKVTENGLELVYDDSGEPIKNVAANSFIIFTIEPDEAHENYTTIQVYLNGEMYYLFHLWESCPLQIEDYFEGEEIVLSFEYSH